MTPEDWSIVRYGSDMQADWNSFVSSSRNGTFLFDRGYMDYHSDRFADHSLMAFRRGKLRAVLPACILTGSGETVLSSHAGLSYGGWVLPAGHIDGADVLALMQATVRHCSSEGFGKIIYKSTPHIYHRQPSEEDLYALWRIGAHEVRCDISSTIRLDCNPGFNTMMRRQLRQAANHDISLAETSDTEAFVAMLDGCLRERHGVSPVHTAAELQLLRSRFPRNIRFFIASADGTPGAGVCVYDTGITAHCQYIASTAEGRALHMLPALFHHLIEVEFADRTFFDFGISNEDGGKFLNEGLHRQKSSFGASGTVCRTFEIPLR